MPRLKKPFVRRLSAKKLTQRGSYPLSHYISPAKLAPAQIENQADVLLVVGSDERLDVAPSVELVKFGKVKMFFFTASR